MPRTIDTPTTVLLADLFDADVQAASSPLVFDPDDLPAGESALVARAVDSRRREFSTGRVLARTLLRQLGAEIPELLRDTDRVPLWPSEVVGSISHCGDLCAVAIGKSSRFRGIGLDVEPDVPVKEGVERIVCRDSEHAWLDAASGDERSRRIKIIFSVKEAVYKAFYPELRTFWSFQDVETEIDLDGERFSASLPEGPEVREIEGRVARREGWILSAVERIR
jgi:4'-phosphopantetheinyl transferase EntD